MIELIQISSIQNYIKLKNKFLCIHTIFFIFLFFCFGRFVGLGELWVIIKSTTCLLEWLVFCILKNLVSFSINSLPSFSTSKITFKKTS